MTFTAKIEVVGVKDTINQLNKLDKELAKEFKAQATQIAQPAISAAKKHVHTNSVVRYVA